DSSRIFSDLAAAVQTGFVLAAMLLICEVANATTVEKETIDSVEDNRLHVLQEKHIHSDVIDVHIHGPFLLGIGEKLHTELTTQMGSRALVVLLWLHNMAALDTIGQLALEDIARTLHSAGRHLILYWARPLSA